MRYSAIIFDLDGTLIDTAPDVRLALNYTLETFNQPPVPPKAIYSLIGKGAKHMLNEAFALNNYSLKNHELEKALDCYLNYYASHPVVETIIYPQVIETLDALSATSLKLGICTNKPGRMTRIVLDRLNMQKYFEVILSGDEVKHPKPQPQHLCEVISKMQIPTTQALMVGDSDVDRQCAENAKVDFVGVSYGYELRPSATENLIHRFGDLLECCNIPIGLFISS